MSIFACRRRTYTAGFTIVELAVVIAVIGILATISIVGYGVYLNRSAETVLKTDLEAVRSELELAKQKVGTYPSSSTGLSKSEGTVYTYSQLYGGLGYCITATSSKRSAIPGYYTSSDTNTVQKGSCSSEYAVVGAVTTLGSGSVPQGGGTNAALMYSIGIDQSNNIFTIVSSSASNGICSGGSSEVCNIYSNGSVYASVVSYHGGYQPYTWVRGPYGIAVANGYVYISSMTNAAIYRVQQGGDLTGASNQGVFFSSGLVTPRGIALDTSGNLYIADSGANRIYKVVLSTTQASLTIGSGVSGFANGSAASAQFSQPYDVAVDGSGTMYVADTNNHRIRKISPEGSVSTLAGAGVAGYADGSGTNAKFSSPQGVAVGADGNIYVADTNNLRIRRITPSGVTTTIAGSGSAGSIDASGLSASFYGPIDVVVGSSGDMYVLDMYNMYTTKVRKLTW